MNKFKIGERVKYVRQVDDDFAGRDGRVLGKTYTVYSLHHSLDYIALSPGGYWIQSYCFNSDHQCMFVSDDGSYTFDTPEVRRAKLIYATIRIMSGLFLISLTVLINLSTISAIGWSFLGAIFPINWSLVVLGLDIIMGTYHEKSLT